MVPEPLFGFAIFQVCWEKFCEYWDVEGRYVPVTKDYPVRAKPSAMLDVLQHIQPPCGMAGPVWPGEQVHPGSFQKNSTSLCHVTHIDGEVIRLIGS